MARASGGSASGDAGLTPSDGAFLPRPPDPRPWRAKMPVVEGRVGAVVLAAGAGTRFGGGKLLAPFQGRPVLQHVLDRLAASPLDPVVVVLGDDADRVGQGIDWRSERRVRNAEPGRGLASSVRLGIEALADDVDAVLIALGDQPLLASSVIDAIVAAGVDRDRPFAAPRYAGDGARNPVLLHRSAFHLVAELTGDRGLGPVLGAHPELVRDVPVADANPDIDTRADLVRLLEEAWAARVRENREQVERHREVPDGSDFYAPVTSLFRADPARTDDAVLNTLLGLVEPGETWLDIGAGAGRFALPLARRLADTGGSVVAVEPSGGMRGALLELAREHRISNVRMVDGRWPDAAAVVRPADVALIAHVGYDIERIGPFVAAMESSVSRLCVAVLMERQPSSVADPCWPLVWGEPRVALPALPAFLEFLEARGSEPAAERVEGAPRGFDTPDELAGFLRRQLWVAEGSSADARFRTALEDVIVRREDGRYGVRDQHPAVIGIVTWRARAA